MTWLYKANGWESASDKKQIQSFSIYLDGDTPNCSVKCFRSVRVSLYPTISAISWMEYLFSIIREAALLIRTLRIISIAASSLRCFIFYKGRLTHIQLLRQHFTLKFSFARLASMTWIICCIKSSGALFPSASGSLSCCFNINVFVYILFRRSRWSIRFRTLPSIPPDWRVSSYNHPHLFLKPATHPHPQPLPSASK